jgi:hypothetical protein
MATVGAKNGAVDSTRGMTGPGEVQISIEW